ncbi:MAG: DUF6265 family protein [Steroidobacteraceae bacterium]
MVRITLLLCASATSGMAGVAGATTCDRLEPASWLLGEWLAIDAGRTITESWRTVSPDTYEGYGETRSIADGKAIDAEVLRLVRMADAVFYVAKVAHNPYPVSFRLVDCPPQRLVFENPSHDFPRRLEYALADDGTLTVAVSDGADEGFTLRFERVGGASP